MSQSTLITQSHICTRTRISDITVQVSALYTLPINKYWGGGGNISPCCIMV